MFDEDLAAKFSRLRSPTCDVPAESAQPMQVDAAGQDVQHSESSLRSVRTLKFGDTTSVGYEALNDRRAVTVSSTEPPRHEVVLIQAAGTQRVVTGQNSQNNHQNNLMACVPFVEAGIKLGISNRVISKEAYKAIKEQQRSTQGMWNSRWAFATGDVHERHSLEACKSFLCMGIARCEVGDCASALGTHDIWELRTRVQPDCLE